MLQEGPSLSLAYAYSHQRTALEFLSQRENGPIPETYQLWKAVEREGQSWYAYQFFKSAKS